MFVVADSIARRACALFTTACRKVHGKIPALSTCVCLPSGADAGASPQRHSSLAQAGAGLAGLVQGKRAPPRSLPGYGVSASASGLHALACQTNDLFSSFAQEIRSRFADARTTAATTEPTARGRGRPVCWLVRRGPWLRSAAQTVERNRSGR